MKQHRLEKILKGMEASRIPQLIVSDPASIFYLTGKWIYPGNRMLALYISLEGDHKLFINELFPLSEDLGVEKVWFKDTDKPIELLSQTIKGQEPIGIDKNWPSRFLLDLMESSKASSYVNGSFIIDRARMIKDSEEIGLMREASRLNDMAMDRLKAEVTRGYSEKKLAQILLTIYEDLGADGFSFDPIIAYGANAADPHHGTGKATPKEGDSVIFDIGCKKDSYCADMTRTVFFKDASEKGREIYQIVLEANKRAIEAVKPGVRFCDVDFAARNYIESKGYGSYFTHRTGHSIGLEVHDFGDVSAINTDLLEPGMIFSIEPGIYIPGEVGVRIEDLVLVTEKGCEVLNKADKEFTII